MVTEMRGIMDIHAHVLPGIDDGARDLEEAVGMLYLAARQGIRGVIATPHRIGNRGQIEELARQAEEGARREYPDFHVYVGQENYYHEELVEQLRAGEALTMAGSRYVLTEFAPGISYTPMYRGIRRLLETGYLPILAHIERYPCLREGNHLTDLAEAGCLMQMNYSGLSGSRFRSETRWRREQVLRGRIDFLATDMHRRDYRPPEIETSVKWLKKHAGEELFHKMTIDNPLCIINREWIRRER